MPQLLGRMVVTGAAGFIGSHLVDRLLANGATHVVGFDNFSRGRLENLAHLSDDRRFELVVGDVRSTSDVSAVVTGANVVYHLAAQSRVMDGVRDVNYTFETNVCGTFNVLRAAAEKGVSCVVFASSREVYGEPMALPVDEESPLSPINSYGASKLAGEAYCRAFRREFGLQTVVLRLANVYGRRDTGRVIPLWLERANARQDLLVYGGKQVVDFVWVGQVVDALTRAGGLDVAVPPINVGSGTGTRIVDLARRIARMADGQVRVRLEAARKMEVTRYIASIQRMREILQIEPMLDPLGKLSDLTGAPLVELG
ncbi:MAG: SDR family NAD(P)-dependent oxidoreductase [Chloroflexi bacterium]|nr:SDR family NAD(P)-dependent oxidoreductase [Chloroflexota bacterium]MBV9547039.1 SDR family NAD(P)-dependent oxidoreductase [Chloroflexota bacterium]